MKVILGILALSIIIVLCIIAANVDGIWLRGWAIGSTILLVPAFIAGVIAGSLKASGMVEGIGVSMKSLSSVYDHATQTTERIQRRQPVPSVNILNAPNDALPPISRARLTDGRQDEVIDL